MQNGQLFSPYKGRAIAQGLLLVLSLGLIAGCLDVAPTENGPSSPVETAAPDDTIGIRDPEAPIVNPGSGLPDFSTGVSGTDEEIDCDNAEDLCDSGAFNCDDIADYCDIGPDDGSDIPDDWDWDQ